MQNMEYQRLFQLDDDDTVEVPIESTDEEDAVGRSEDGSAREVSGAAAVESILVTTTSMDTLRSSLEHVSTESTVTNMETEQVTKDNLQKTYFQCRAVRDSSFQNNAIYLGTGDKLGSVVGGEPARIGCFKEDDHNIKDGFIGSRVHKGGNPIHQNMACSFDPANKMCIACPAEHPILTDSPVAICLSDQNMPKNLSEFRGEKNCVGVIRLETAGIDELCDIFCETFDGVTFPDGSVICIGSATHLHRMGATVYASDWCRCVARLSAKFPTLQISPLAPVLSQDFPGSLAVDLAVITAWFRKIYGGSIIGLSEVWDCFITNVTGEISEAAGAVPYFFTVALPASLNLAAPLIPVRFARKCSDRAILSGISATKVAEQVRQLISALQTKFGIDCNPGGYSQGEPHSGGMAKDDIPTKKKLILIGNSNMRNFGYFLHSKGYDTYVTKTRWTGTPESGKKIAEEIGSLGLNDAAAIFTIGSNCFYRFSQVDGGSALPVMLGGRAHMPGNLTVATASQLKRVVDAGKSVLTALNNIPTVVIPPLPRYLNGGCCGDLDHAPNVRDPDHGKKVMEQVAHARKLIKDQLAGKNNVWVAEAGKMTGDDPGSAADQSQIFGGFLATDNVHLNNHGFNRLLIEVDRCIKKLREKDTAEISVPGRPRKTYFWRGFMSLNGSATRAVLQGGQRGQRGRQHRSRSHPYKR